MVNEWLPGMTNIDPINTIAVAVDCKKFADARACPSGGDAIHCTVTFWVGARGYVKPLKKIELGVFNCNCCYEKRKGKYAKGAHWATSTMDKYGVGRQEPLTPELPDVDPWHPRLPRR